MDAGDDDSNNGDSVDDGDSFKSPKSGSKRKFSVGSRYDELDDNELDTIQDEAKNRGSTTATTSTFQDHPQFVDLTGNTPKRRRGRGSLPNKAFMVNPRQQITQSAGSGARGRRPQVLVPPRTAPIPTEIDVKAESPLQAYGMSTQDVPLLQDNIEVTTPTGATSSSRISGNPQTPVAMQSKRRGPKAVAARSTGSFRHQGRGVPPGGQGGDTTRVVGSVGVGESSESTRKRRHAPTTPSKKNAKASAVVTAPIVAAPDPTLNMSITQPNLSKTSDTGRWADLFRANNQRNVKIALSHGVPASILYDIMMTDYEEIVASEDAS